ncbi:recombinase family protein [Methylophaga nitratireducenticrescens]|uniref:recombinase family protein n=1 Tax=Methylophaga nitratireducenticrescens TaxID=754476 RepID=UPI000CDC02FA|nr:recombinase family protein [Methylophaga nitratireducenticrescens]AUZ83793.1 serine recombinase [Methylophaga nitratireducenticrescens]
MFIRAYLRASTSEQDASRAKDQLQKFAEHHDHKIANWFIENESGAKAERPELIRMIKDSLDGDIILVEAVDRLSRLKRSDWDALRAIMQAKRLRVVALDLPTSHAAMSVNQQDEFTSRMLDAVNSMMLDMLAAIARKDYEQRRERQKQGINNAKLEGKYKGRPKDEKLRQKIHVLLEKGFSIRKIAEIAGCAPSTVQRVNSK